MLTFGPIFLLLVPSPRLTGSLGPSLRATNGLVGMEIPTDAEPEDATAVLAIVDKGIDGIV